MLKNIDKEDLLKFKTSQIKELANKISPDEYLDFINLYEADERKSVQSICNSLVKKLDKIKKEKDRLIAINQFEETAYEKGYMYIGGIDEAGRGPLAGPVVAAIVVFDRMTMIDGIDDSKKLSETKREELFEYIIKNAKDYGIGIADNNEIDEINILNATYLAMKRAIDMLQCKPDCLLNDAVRIPDIDIDQVPIIKGDSKSISIAAASILAKVTRDRIMYDMDKEYPFYNFSSNKGYGTKDHYNGIMKYGITPIHRKSFLKNIKY